MSIAATKAFQFISEMPGLSIERHEFEDKGFEALRFAMRKCVRNLSETEDSEAHDLSSRLARAMFLWLSAPVCFDETLLEPLESEGNPTDLNTKFAIPFTSCIHAATSLVRDANLFPNPLRAELQSIIRTLTDQRENFKIYCWRSVQPYFESLLQEENAQVLSDSHFIHSVAAYRASDCFEVLIKVGPMRSKGISAIADACLSAPKFRKLIQFVWAGCEDEEGIGFDPAASSDDYLEALPSGFYDALRSDHTHSCLRALQPPVSDPQELKESVNEFEDAAFDANRREKCTACLVEVIGGEAWVTTPFSAELSFDPRVAGDDAVDFRAAADDLEEGMFLIIPHTGEIDVGAVDPQADLASIWKLKLNEEIMRDASFLCGRLQQEGVRIKHLGAAVRRWATPASKTGIHAPLIQSNFEKLIRVIQVRPNDPHWWALAWAEIQQHNGRARQDGRVEGQITRDLQIQALKERIHELQTLAYAKECFSLPLRSQQQLEGSFECFKICGLLEGYTAPLNRLREFVGIAEADEWREY
jgi:hypothetical protein